MPIHWPSLHSRPSINSQSDVNPLPGPSTRPHPPPPIPVHSAPTPGVNYSSQLPPQSQPRTIKLTSTALLSLPYRLTHPPPANNQVSSWSIVPTFDIDLQDILDRKHLPPLGLKDFEEWLLFVEHSPENLYFILWLREYTARYTAWAQSTKQHLASSASAPHQPPILSASNSHRDLRTNLSPTPFPTHPNTPFILPPPSPSRPAFLQKNRHPLTSPIPPSPPPSPTPSLHPPPPRRRSYYHHPRTPPPPPPSSLALFYLRAKETFLTPDGSYELDVPSDVLTVFHTSPSATASKYAPPYTTSSGNNPQAWYDYTYTISLSPPPDPEVFSELKGIIEERLKASLTRFVVATYNNVGMPRAYCGSVGGMSIGIIWSVPPLAANFALGGARWWRVIALPGMWLGLTIFISAMYGVCMMIYVFGDLRQLRSFELARPSISPPKPLISSHSAHPDPNHSSNSRHSRFRGGIMRGSGGRGKAGGGGNEGGKMGEMISGPVVKPVKPITRPPKAVVRYAQPSATGGGAEKPVLKIVTNTQKDREGENGGKGDKAGRELKSRWSEDTSIVADHLHHPQFMLKEPEGAVTRRRHLGDAHVEDFSESSSASSECSSSYLSDEDEEYSGSSYSEGEESEEEEDSGEDESEEESEEDGDTESAAMHEQHRHHRHSRSRHHHRRHHHRQRKPRIFISDAFYDEHPSPEGPATTTFSPAAGWGSHPTDIASSSRPSEGGGGTNGQGEKSGKGTKRGPVFWPDYETNEEEEMNATAAFIHPYVYEDTGYKFGSAPRIYSYSHPSHAPEDDLEAQAHQRTAERQPMGSFDFEALPPRRPRKSSSKSIPGGARHQHQGSSSSYHKSPPRPQPLPLKSSYQRTAPISPASPVSPVSTSPRSPHQQQQREGNEEALLGARDVEKRGCWRGQFKLKVHLLSETERVAHEREKQARSSASSNANANVKRGVDAESDGEEGEEARVGWIWSFLGRVQSKCSPGNVVSVHLARANSPVTSSSTFLTTNPPIAEKQYASPRTEKFDYPLKIKKVNKTKAAAASSTNRSKASSWRAGFRKVSAVPAFASPLTPVLNPVVGRAQWEIVVRSALMAAVFSFVVVGALLGIPETVKT